MRKRRRASFRPLRYRDFKASAKPAGHDYYTLVELQAQLNLKRFPSEERFERFLQRNKVRPKYIRNYPLLNSFFGDFVWPEKKLVIEIDGSSHVDRQGYDGWRDSKLQEAGYRIIRLPAHECPAWHETLDYLLALYPPRTRREWEIPPDFLDGIDLEGIVFRL